MVGGKDLFVDVENDKFIVIVLCEIEKGLVNSLFMDLIDCEE